MRFSLWRGALLASAIAAMTTVGGAPAFAGGFLGIGHHSIPRETLAQDFRTGDVMYAPPVPYGHYTKDLAGCIHNAAGLAHGMLGKVCGLCLGRGLGCGACGGSGCLHGNACGSCGGAGCNDCGGLGLLQGHGLGLGHKIGGGCGAGVSGCDGGDGCGHGHLAGGGFGHGQGGLGGGLLHHKDAACGTAGCGVSASGQSSGPVYVQPSSQTVSSCGTCGGSGMLHGGLFGRRDSACGSCGGQGLLGGLGHGGGGSACGSCGGAGCGACGGSGLFGGHGGSACNSCGGAGCGLCGGSGLLGGLKSKLHSAAGLPLGVGSSLLGKFGHGGVDYFVGPGGPVPITPGYVPYINPVRSPRDFFAFPPFSDQAF